MAPTKEQSKKYQELTTQGMHIYELLDKEFKWYHRSKRLYIKNYYEQLYNNGLGNPEETTTKTESWRNQGSK